MRQATILSDFWFQIRHSAVSATHSSVLSFRFWFCRSAAGRISITPPGESNQIKLNQTTFSPSNL
jgi:hypothetical protein